MSNQQATKFLVMNCIDYLSISLCGCKWHFHEKKRKKEYTLNVTWMTFSDFISSNNNIIIASNRCSRSGWIFFLAPVVKPDLIVDYACTQLVKFEEFFVYYQKKKELPSVQRPKNRNLSIFLMPLTWIPLVDLAAWKWECQLQHCHVLQLHAYNGSIYSKVPTVYLCKYTVNSCRRKYHPKLLDTLKAQHLCSNVVIIKLFNLLSLRN